MLIAVRSLAPYGLTILLYSSSMNILLNKKSSPLWTFLPVDSPILNFKWFYLISLMLKSSNSNKIRVSEFKKCKASSSIIKVSSNIGD